MKKTIILFLFSIFCCICNAQDFYFDTYYKFIDSETKNESLILSNSKDSTYTMMGSYAKNGNPSIATIRQTNSNQVFSFLIINNLYDFKYLAKDSPLFNITHDYEYEINETPIDENHLKVEIKVYKIKKKSKKIASTSYIIYEKSDDFKFNILGLNYYTHCILTKTKYKESNFGYPIEINTEFTNGKKSNFKLELKLKINKTININN